MTDDVTGSDDGTFVIAGVTVREGAADLVQWSSGRVAAVAPIEITIGPGITVTVDVARPSDVLALRIADFGDPAKLTSACVPENAPAIDHIARSEPPSASSLTLRRDWARKAVVAGVTRWLPSPIHEGALLLDDAASHHAVGEGVASARLIALAMPVLEALTLDSEDGFLSAATSVELKSVAQAAASAVAGLSWGAEVGALAERVAAATGLSQTDLDDALRRLIEQESPALIGALAAGVDDATGDYAASATAAQLRTQAIDPRATTARVLRWIDADYEEVHVTETRNGGSGTAEFAIELSDFIDPRCQEVGRVNAFVADGTTGALLRTGRTRLSGRTLRAALTYELPRSGNVVFGVYDAGLGVADLRTRTTDRTRAAIDRLLVDAWNTHRSALVIQARIADVDPAAAAPAAARSADLLNHAIGLAGEALAKLEFEAQQDPTGVAARTAAVSGYLADLRDQRNAPLPGCEPLLAELLPITPG